MRRFAFSVLLGAVVVAAALPAAAGPPGDPLALDGTWILVEQTYGKGGSNLADAEAPIRLRIVPAATGGFAWIWQGADPQSGSEWPSLVANGAELRALSRSIRIDAGSSTIHGQCAVVPVEGEDLVLHVHESYSLTPDRRSLVGTVEVRFKGGDRNRGGYTLHRRFERDER